MSITLLSRESRERAIEWSKATLSLFIMPYTSENLRTHIRQHVAALEAHGGALDADCRIETGTDGTLKITTTLRPIAGAPADAKVS